MADPVIVWSSDPENVGGFVGRVDGIAYCNIYQMGPTNFVLFTKYPNEVGFSQGGNDADSLKDAAVDQLAKYLTMLKNTMVAMGLLE